MSIDENVEKCRFERYLVKIGESRRYKQDQTAPNPGEYFSLGKMEYVHGYTQD